MKKCLCALLALLLALCITSALAEGCKYEGQGSPCDVKWWVDTVKREHCRACFYHVEDKEDMNSHVQITDWTPCTLDEGGQCTCCGYDYVREPSYEDYEMYWLEFYMMLSAEYGTAPVNVSVSGSRLTISMKDDFFRCMEDMGVPVSESMMVDTKFTLTLPGGNDYAYTGEAVKPEVQMTASEYGPGAWMQKYGIVEFGQPVYEKNTAIGTATVKVEVSVREGKTYTVSKNFNIKKMAERVPGDADGDGVIGLMDALAILQQSASVNTRNADVNGDGTVDIQDALRIFQREAGWDVKLQ